MQSLPKLAPQRRYPVIHRGTTLEPVLTLLRLSVISLMLACGLNTLGLTDSSTAGDTSSGTSGTSGTSDTSGGPTCAEPVFIERDEVLLSINQDLSSVNLPALPFTRYFTFVHLHNAGYCDSEIEVYRQALSKLVNSLSQAAEITAPVAIDDDRLIFRIDIRDYQWQRVEGEFVRLSEPSVYFRDGDTATINPDEQKELDKEFKDVWEMMADQNPYPVEYPGDIATTIKSLTNTNFPIIQGDAFIDVTSRSPLYYDILNIPKRGAKLHPKDPDCGEPGTPEECLETQLSLDVLNSIDIEILEDNDGVGRAGFKISAISDFNRVVERHRFPNANNRTFWISYDFRGALGTQNITVHPLDFDLDSGAIIFTLPNGLQGYMLTNAAGWRLNEGPTDIMQDESQRDYVVRNGVSCIGCHIAGIIEVQDDIRSALDNGTLDAAFDDADKLAIKRLYPTREDFKPLQQQDIARFNASLGLAAVTPGTEKEPVITSFLAFDEDVTLRRVGAEYGLTEHDMLKYLGLLSADLIDLADGGTVHRRDFTEYFRTGVCILDIGCTRSCPDPC